MPYANNKGTDQSIRAIWSAPSLFAAWWYYTSTCYIRNFKPLASLCSWAGRFESYLVANHEDRFSRNGAHLSFNFSHCTPTLQIFISANPLQHLAYRNSIWSSLRWLRCTGVRIRIRIDYWWNAETTTTHQDLWLGNYPLALTRKVNLAIQSSASSADENRESGRAFQSLIVWGKKLPL